jgi:hypothetical protein
MVAGIAGVGMVSVGKALKHYTTLVAQEIFLS